MVCTIRSLGFEGVMGCEVTVECYISGGLPSFDIVGLPDAAVKEARDRVRATVKNCGFRYPTSRITVNLAPADIKKYGTIYDLPVLLGVLLCSDALPPIPNDAAFIGELSLSGELRAVPGALPMALCAARNGIKSLFLPADNAEEAAFADGLDVYPVKTVSELVEHLTGAKLIKKAEHIEPVQDFSCALDFADVKGQLAAKRALEIAAAGAHNVLLCGAPGSGKSMLAKCLPSILPDMTKEEMIECTEIYSIGGLTRHSAPIVASRPFRSPHHSISAVALAGGTQHPRPGEISLSHNGVLFLDEFPEFPKDVLEVLRQPLEDGQVTISRASMSVTFPSRFMLVAAMNPCRCGWYGDSSGRCTCSAASVQKYRGRISGPLLDRIDLNVNVQRLEYDELSRPANAEPSSEIRKRVNAAREIQRERYNGTSIHANAYLTPKAMEKYCALDDKCQEIMKKAFQVYDLTARSYDRIVRVGRTIADLKGHENIDYRDLAEALHFRVSVPTSAQEL